MPIPVPGRRPARPAGPPSRHPRARRAASRLGAGLMALAALGACAAGGDAARSTPGAGTGASSARPAPSAAECRALLADARPQALAARGVALVLARPELVEGAAARPVALRLREQMTGAGTTLGCVDVSPEGTVVYGGVPPGRWHLEALVPLAAGAPAGDAIAPGDSPATQDELRFGAGEAVHLGRPSWRRVGAALDFRPGLDETAERATVRRLAPQVGTALLLRQLGQDG